MAKWIRWLACSLAAAALEAPAAFHLWTMDEVYSNADGTVQFLELTAITGGQQFLNGHTLVSTNGATTPHMYTFSGNLPSDTTGRKFLVGTQGFAALNVVTPDYIVPNGFFFQNGGTINFAEGSDVWSHPALPTDGTNSLNRSGSTGTNSPTNFFFRTGTVAPSTPAPALNFQALWWGGPTESGWGINITHQGDILFATLFTHDQSGNPLWLVLAAGARQGSSNTYSGTLYRAVGSPFNAVPFVPQQAADVTPVGTMTLAFSSANAATLTYSVSGISVVKSIEKQDLAGRFASCEAVTGSRASATNYQDLWFNPSESGWGVNLTHAGDIVFATLFVYDSNRQPFWYVLAAGNRQPDGSYFGELYRTTGSPFNAQPYVPQQASNVVSVGTMRFRPQGGENGTLEYTVNGISVTKAITRQVYTSPVTACE